MYIFIGLDIWTEKKILELHMYVHSLGLPLNISFYKVGGKIPTKYSTK